MRLRTAAVVVGSDGRNATFRVIRDQNGSVEVRYDVWDVDDNESFVDGSLVLTRDEIEDLHTLLTEALA